VRASWTLSASPMPAAPRTISPTGRPARGIRRGGGYHYYPTPDRVSGWLEGAGLRVIDEATSQATNDAYHHVVLSSEMPRCGQT
jgi:hypothetical protein